MAQGFDAPPTIERSGSEHRRAVTSLALLERARAWEWVKDPSSQEGDRGVEKFMITTRIEPSLLTGLFDTVVTVDTKVNMLMAANIWGV